MQSHKFFIIFTLLISVLSFHVAGQYDFTASNTEGCTPLQIKYTFTSTALVDTVGTYFWDFGNGQTSNQADPDTVTYASPGIYNISLVLTFANGGELTIDKPAMVTIHRTVPASFNSYDSVSYTVYVFEHVHPLDTGVTYSFNWNIETFPLKTGRRQVIVFADTGTYTVTLTVSDEFGCSSTFSEEIHVAENFRIQNVFTPNDDGLNDFFLVTSHGGIPLSLSIFTRAGVLVYSAEGITITWDGRTASGLKLNPGIYFYTIKAISGDPDEQYSKAGFLYLYK